MQTIKKYIDDNMATTKKKKNPCRADAFVGRILK